MKRLKAFLTALLLFVITAAACHVYIAGRTGVDNPAFATWPNEEKGESRAGLTENLNGTCYPVFGSSEFQHGVDTIYHPASVFADTEFHPMLIGGGYYQSLSHAITLAAIEPSMEIRKAALIISPQWFRRPGVVDQAFASRFSEPLYMAMLENDRLSDSVKEYISRRTDTLLQVDSRTLDHVKLEEKTIWKKEGSFMENLQGEIWKLFLREKDLFQISAMLNQAGIRKGSPHSEEDREPDWEALMKQAQADGEAENNNEFFMDDISYKKLEPYLPEKKDMNKDAVTGYQKSPEYDDLRCFLTVCQELEIEPLLIMIPVNGYYYDYTGFPVQARQGYYANIRQLAGEFDARVVDLADQEYTRYFFEDRVHLGKKGWVAVCESLYEFYQEK